MGKNQTQTNQKKKKIIHTFQKKKKKGSPENEIIKSLEEKYPSIDPSAIKSFTDFPLSQKTLKGLKDCKYKTPTDIQRESIGLALKGTDILGAAQTGSGKTLAFLIPVLEKLFCLQWTNLDGLGALIITPTRELAYQIFETLKKIGKYHDFSAGLIIGGKDLKVERDRMSSCNIMICTPGRLLQHMDENPVFDCVNMKILVLDEADRCLDMGFERTMNAIIENLPPVRQTLLFSATQTRSVRDLARLSLKEPAYVAVHEHLAHSTPAGLQQSYIVCELKDKLAVLWSFIKEHSKQKVIVFFASCKQAKYMFEIFSRLGPSTSLFALYGSLHQLRRMDVYDKFCSRQSAVLLATDLAARGLDFPEVHWVVQADCPEDTDTYIHRVGRTARYHRGGESLLLLLPSEQEMVGKLAERKIPVERIDVNPMKLRNPIVKMQCGLAKNPELSESAKRAFGSYIKSVFLMKDKSVFKVDALDTDSFAYSLGLAVPPRIRFLQRYNSRQQKNKNENVLDATHKIKEEKFDSSEAEEKMYVEDKKNNDRKGFTFDSDESDSDDCLTLKRRDIELPPLEESEQINSDKKKVVTKAAAAKKLLKHNIVWSKKTVFDDEGEIVPQTNEKKSQLAQEYENEDVSGIDIEKARMVLKEEDKFDKQLFKEKVKAKHKKKKDKLKAAKKKEQEEKKRDDTEAVDEFPDSDGDSGSLPDLSWLPDPDKVYPDRDDESDELKKDELEEESHFESPTPTSAPAPKPKKNPKKRKQNEDSNKTERPKKARVSKIIEGLSLDQAEEVALQLLK